MVSLGKVWLQLQVLPESRDILPGTAKIDLCLENYFQDQRLISPACLHEAFMCADPKSTKRQSAFLCFWDQQAQKRLVKRW